MSVGSYLTGAVDRNTGIWDRVTFGLTSGIRRVIRGGCDPQDTSGADYRAGYGRGKFIEYGLALLMPEREAVEEGATVVAEKTSGVSWAEKSGMLRDAASGRGNYGLGAASARDADELGVPLWGLGIGLPATARL